MRMRKFTLLLAITMLLGVTMAQAQTPGTKGNGQIFYTQTFGWENPADERGWTAPEGYYFLDALDQGTNFVWWPAGKGFVSTYTQDPPLNSTTKNDGCIANFIEEVNWADGNLDVPIYVDNSLGFPPFDCSAHSTVVVSFETHFMAYSVAHMWLEISVDDWVHSATYSTAFGCGHKDRPLDKAPGEPALFQANISDVAAGQPNVKMRLHWLDTYLYYWAFDDFSLSEAWTNDLKMDFIQLEWEDNDPNTTFSWIANIPKCQLDGTNGFINFKSSVLNFGEYDQEAVYMDIDITKNGTSVFHKMSVPADIPVLSIDTADIADKYSPVDYGHYRINWDFKAKEADENPANNQRAAYFNVTDSVFSRSGNVNGISWALTKETYVTAAVENLNHFAGSIFHIYNDCEVSSISVYVTGGKADEFLNYRFVLFYQPPGEALENSFELLTTDMIQLDSSQFNTWITMPLSKDGESEFLKKGDIVYAGFSQNNTNADHLIRRNQGMAVGTDNSVKLHNTPTIAIYDGTYRVGDSSSDYVGKRNLMIRLNLNEHGNLVDGVNVTASANRLEQNYPNPISTGSTQIEYNLVDASDVTFSVMDLTGRKVVEINEGMMPAGKNTFTLQTSSLDAGIYYYTIKAGTFVQTKQMVVVNTIR